MDTLTAIEQRRAVKHYDPAHCMSDDEVRRLLSLAMLSPTAFNIPVSYTHLTLPTIYSV